jgi:hypothetical protein
MLFSGDENRTRKKGSSGAKNKRFGAMANPKCDSCVSFCGVRGHVRLRWDTSMLESKRSLHDSSTDQRLDVDSERLTFDLKHNVPRIVCNLDNFIFIFKDVPRQQNLSGIDPQETRIMSAAHAEAVPIHFDRPCSISSGFLIVELCADGAKAIDIELFQVGSNVSRGPTRRKNGQQGAC